MLSAIGLIIAIALLIVMIVKGVDMITASVVTAAIILVTSGLDFWEGLLKTFSEGAGSFCTSWFLILALGGIFGELVNQTGLATKVAKSLSAALGAKRVGLIIMICTFFITLLGINGYIMVFVLYPIADSLLRENKMDRRLLPFLMIAGGANANGFAFSMDICNVIPSNFLGTSLGVAPVLAVIFSVITCTWYVIYFNYAQKKSMEKMSEAERMALYKTEKSVMGDNELPGLFMSLLPFILVLAVVVVTSGMGKAGQIAMNIATTFCSTGIPSVFLHPSEAQHGDLGILQKNDLLLLISNSGKTREIVELTRLAHNLDPDLKFIVITGNPDSPLAKESDVCLSTGKPAEVCVLGMTPTTSTTAMTVIGDILVVQTMKETGFTIAEYSKRHHGGYLGEKSRSLCEK